VAMPRDDCGEGEKKQKMKSSIEASCLLLRAMKNHAYKPVSETIRTVLGLSIYLYEESEGIVSLSGL